MIHVLRRNLQRIVLALLALAFAWFVWPTPYRTIGTRGSATARFTLTRSCARQIRISVPPGSPTL